MAVVEIIYDVKPYSYITSNPTKILSNGEPIYLSDGRYGFGDGITTLSSLPLYGGSGYAFTGLTSQYTRGDGTYATFPTNVSSFTNDSGYITNSALSPYLTIANAALTYQPIGSYLTGNQTITVSGDASGSGATSIALTLATVNSNVGTFNNVTVNAKGLVTAASNVSYLTGLTVGSTAIGSGTNTRILYNNSGVLGEYLVTGTGTTAVLSTSPTISTSLTVTTASTTNVIRDLVGTPTSSAIYLNQASPSSTNYALGYTNTNEVSLNTPVIGRIRSGGTICATWYSTSFTINASNGLDIANNSNDVKIVMTRTSGNTHSLQLSSGGYFMYNNTVGAVRYGVTNAGNFYVGDTSSLATTATDGFLYLPSCAGVPTGVPTAITGKVPIVVDSTNNKAYIYSGGAWVALN